MVNSQNPTAKQYHGEVLGFEVHFVRSEEFIVEVGGNIGFWYILLVMYDMFLYAEFMYPRNSCAFDAFTPSVCA